MATQQYNVAFVGGGEQAGYLLRMAVANVPGVTAVAVADINRETAHRFGAEYGLRPYESIESLAAAEDIDIFYVCTPPRAHSLNVEQIVRATRSRRRPIGLYVEKPPEVSLDRLEHLLRVAEEAGAVLTFGLDRRYSPGLRWLRDLAASGDIGRVYLIRGGWCMNDCIPRRGAFTNTEISGGGPGMDLLPHLLDGAMFVLGHGPLDTVTAIALDAIAAQGGSRGDRDPQKIDVEDYFKATFQRRSDEGLTVIDTEVSWDVAVDGERFWFEVFGTRGHGELTFERDGDHVTYIPSAALFDGTPIPADIDPGALHTWRTASLVDLAEALRLAREGLNRGTDIHGGEAWNVLAAIRAAYDSAKQGGELVRVRRP